MIINQHPSNVIWVHHSELHHIESHQKQQQYHEDAPPHHRVQLDNQRRAEQLNGEVDHRHQPVRHPFLVRQYLVKVKPVRLHDVLFQKEAMEYSHHRIHPVYHQEAQPYQVLRLHDQQQQQGHDPEGDGYAPHVAREAPRPLPEVEEEEHHRRQHREPYQVRMHEAAICQIHVLQRCQHRDAVETRDPIDAIHEVIGIHDADEDDVTNHDRPPGIDAEHPRQVKSAAHCQQVKQQAHPLSQAHDIVHEAHPRDQRDAREEPQPLGREMKQQVQQRRHPPDDPPTPYGNVIVRTPLVRFVYDVKPVRDPEIKKFCRKQQN